MTKLIFWILAMLASIGAIFSPNKEDAEAPAAIIRYGSEDDAYSIGYALSSNGNVSSSGGMMNADESALATGDTFALELPEGLDSATLTLTVGAGLAEGYAPVAGEVELADGKSYAVTVSGSAKDGYTLEYEEISDGE